MPNGIPRPGSTRFYREALTHLPPTEIQKLKEFIRSGASSQQMYEWFIGMATDEVVEQAPINEPISQEAQSLASIIQRYQQAEILVTAPSRIEASEQPAILRFLAYQLEKSMPEMIDDETHPGDIMISIGLAGIKELNDQHIGISTAAEIVAYFHDQLDIALREQGINGITELPTQQIWKRFSIRIDTREAERLEEALQMVQESVKARVGEFIDQHPNIKPETKEKVKERLRFNLGSATAKEDTQTVDLWYESVMAGQIESTLELVDSYQESICNQLTSEEFTKLTQILNENPPQTPEEKATYLFRLAQEIRASITALLQESALEEMFLPLAQNPNELGFSQHCFSLIRSGKIEEFLSKTASGKIGGVSVSQRMQIMNAIRVYAEILSAPMAIKCFTMEEIDSQIQRCRSLREQYEKLIELIRSGHKIQDEDDETLVFLNQVLLNLYSDQRFTPISEDVSFTSANRFDTLAVRLDNPMYLSLDIMGVGSQYLENAQAAQVEINAAENTYAAICTQGKNLGEASWQMIRQTFSKVGQTLAENPTLHDYFREMHGIPASIKGDELVMALPYHASQPELFTDLSAIQNTLLADPQFGPIRLTVAQANRQDVSGISLEKRTQLHIHTRLLSEKEGIHIAKIFEGLQNIIGTPIIVEVSESNEGEIRFRLQYSIPHNQKVEATEWFTQEALYKESEIDAIKNEVLRRVS